VKQVDVSGFTGLKKAMDDFAVKAPAIISKAMEEVVKRGFPRTIDDYAPYVPKVHLFKDNSEDRAKGKKRMKDILCRSNSGQLVTDDPFKVTCKRCRSRMSQIKSQLPDDFDYQSVRGLSAELDAERDHADKLFDFLAMVFKQCGHEALATVVIPGSNIGLGDVVKGALAFHIKRRADDGQE
jgi:hypothetical protein